MDTIERSAVPNKRQQHTYEIALTDVIAPIYWLLMQSSVTLNL